MNYKIFTILIIAILCSLSACTKGANEMSINNKNNNPKSQIAEKDKIEKGKSDSLDLNKFNITNEEDNRSGIMIMPTITGESSELRFKKFTGTHTMMKISMKKNESIELKYNCKVESGKFNILIQDEKYNIVQQINDNKQEKILLKATEAGDYIIRAVGDEASEGQIIIKFK